MGQWKERWALGRMSRVIILQVFKISQQKKELTMESRKEDNCWIDFLKPVNRKEAKYPLSKREGMDSGAQAKGLPLT